MSRFARGLVATEKDRVERFVQGLRMSLQKDLALCELPSHAEALDKDLKAEWVRDQMNTDHGLGRSGDHSRITAKAIRKENGILTKTRTRSKRKRVVRDVVVIMMSRVAPGPLVHVFSVVRRDI